MLAYLLDNPVQLSLINNNAEKVGLLSMNIIPKDSTWEKDPEDPSDDPRDNRIILVCGLIRVVKKPIYFTVKIDKASGLPKGYHDIFCQYRLPYPTQTFLTKRIPGPITGPEFNFEQRHSYDYVTETLLNFLLESALSVKVYGYTTKSKAGAGKPRVAEEETKEKAADCSDSKPGKGKDKDKEKEKDSSAMNGDDSTRTGRVEVVRVRAVKESKGVPVSEKSNVLRITTKT